jgi:hypothetical protein
MPPSTRDAVSALDGEPSVVSVSDCHGHLEAARSALLTLADHPDHDAVVVADADGRLHWAGNDHVLVVNGDCVDRGPDSEGVLALVDRLQTEAPEGRVRYLLGNHERHLVFPRVAGRDRWYCDTVDDDARRAFLDDVLAGRLSVAYGGYAYTYSHAGAPSGVDPETANDAGEEVARALRDLVGGPRDTPAAFEDVTERSPVFRTGDEDLKGPGAGPLWLDFVHLPAHAPPQVVGHTPHGVVTRKGNVVCEDTILQNAGRDGGESVLVETPDSLTALVRRGDGSVDAREV